jgi:hypothetical protein
MADFDEIRQQMKLLSDEELSEILQEHDEDQWRPEVFDIVGAILRERGISLSKTSAPEEDGLDEIEGLDFVAVANYYSSMDAEADRTALEVKRIKAWIIHKKTSTQGAPNIELRVLAEDLVAAMATLESEPTLSTDLPPELAEPPCPKCGSRKVKEEAETVEEATNSHILIPKQLWLYHCAACGHKWSEP